MAKSTQSSKSASTKSKSTKSKAAPSKGKGKRGQKRTPTPRFRLSEVLPGRVTDIEAVKDFATKVDAAEALKDLNQALDTLQERTTELYSSLQGRADALEESARERFEEQLEEVRERAGALREKAQDTKAGKLLQELPTRATSELDDILAKLGLMRTVTHEEEVETLRNRYKGLMKAAATKARNQALKEAKKNQVPSTK